MRRWYEEGRESEREIRKLELYIMIYGLNRPTHCTYENTHTPAQTHPHPHTCRHAHTPTHLYTQTRPQPHTCTHRHAHTHTPAHTDTPTHTPVHTDMPTPTHLHRHLLKQSLYCCETTSKGTKTHFKFQFGNEEGGCFSLPGNTKHFT